MSDLVEAKAAVVDHIKADPDATAALKAIGWQFAIDAALAVAGVFVAVMDQLAPALSGLLPQWAAALVVAGLAAAKVALNKYLAGKHSAAVVNALATPVPDSIAQAYGVKQ